MNPENVDSDSSPQSKFPKMGAGLLVDIQHSGSWFLPRILVQLFAPKVMTLTAHLVA
jgi:hypothetical protein